MAFCRDLLSALIGADAWGTEAGTIDERAQVSARLFRAGLWAFFSRRRTSHPHERLTELADFTWKMIGPNSKRALKTKVAESWSVFLYCLELVDAKQGHLGEDGPRWVAAANALYGYVQVCKTSPRVMPRARIQECHDFMLRHVTLLDGLVDKTPKHHLWMHLTDGIGFLGNPCSYDTWANEGANYWLKRACSGCHAACFETKAFTRIKALLRRREPA